MNRNFVFENFSVGNHVYVMPMERKRFHVVVPRIMIIYHFIVTIMCIRKQRNHHHPRHHRRKNVTHPDNTTLNVVLAIFVTTERSQNCHHCQRMIMKRNASVRHAATLYWHSRCSVPLLLLL